MKPITALLPRVMPYAPNCPAPTALSHLRRAAVALCERTRLWRVSQSYPASQFITLEAPAGAVVYQVESIRQRDFELERYSIGDMDMVWPTWRTAGSSELSRYVTLADDGNTNTMRLVPPPEAYSDPVHFALYLRPSDAAAELPDWMVDDHSTVLADGALSTLLLLPGQPFTNADLATYHAQLFAEKLDRLAASGYRGKSRGRTRTKSSFF